MISIPTRLNVWEGFIFQPLEKRRGNFQGLEKIFPNLGKNSPSSSNPWNFPVEKLSTCQGEAFGGD